MTLHVVEPTLNSYAGHCHSFVEAITQAAPLEKIVIWASRGSESFWHSGGHLEAYFYAPLRKFQAFILYRDLLGKPGKMLIATAGTSDLITLDFVAGGQIPKAKVYLYVHWIGSKASKTAKLAEVARRQPHLEILCPTQEGTDFFARLGFRAHCVSYPQKKSAPYFDGQPFRHLVVAGAARLDKGFDRIVDLVGELAWVGMTWPISVQVSPTHRNRHPVEISSQIRRLEACNYSPMTLLKKTLPPASYHALFSGGISIQPYSVSEFQDRISGVTLDALSAGCPVVASANTWLSKIVLRYQAGVATSDLSAPGLRAAVETILSDYDGYSRRAFEAGVALREQHSADKLVRLILGPARPPNQ